MAESFVQKNSQELGGLNVGREVECAICINMMSLKSDVVQLKCNKFHIFHSKCLQQALEHRQQCPLCRCDIKNDEVWHCENDVKSKQKHDNTDKEKNTFKF